MTKFSKERIAFYTEVQEYHKNSDLRPEFHRSALEKVFKEKGGDPWSLTEEDFQQYAEWRRGRGVVVTKFSKERIAFYTEVQEYHKNSDLRPEFHRSALEKVFKEKGGDPWSLTEEDFQQYAEWRRGRGVVVTKFSK